MNTEYQTANDITPNPNGESGDGVLHIKKLTTEKLFDNASEILILHAGESYMLTITKQKKLLLTKVKHGFR